MNFFAHGCRFLDDPYFVAGTAVPDWLNVVDRKVRARARGARPLRDDPDRRVAAIAAGICQHHADDHWFHSRRAFVETSTRFSVELRDRLPGDESLRPSFVGHIVVELLLDAELIAAHRGRLGDYYRAIESVDAELVQGVVNRIAARPTDRLGQLVARWAAERFLYDYADDAKLWGRLNQVMRRVGLAPLPPEVVPWLATARVAVRRVADELYPPPDDASQEPRESL